MEFRKSKTRDKFAMGIITGALLSSLLLFAVVTKLGSYYENKYENEYGNMYDSKVAAYKEEITQETLTRVRKNALTLKGKEYIAFEVGGVVEQYTIKFDKFLTKENDKK